jgi:hypothetical protein
VAQRPPARHLLQLPQRGERARRAAMGGRRHRPRGASATLQPHAPEAATPRTRAATSHASQAATPRSRLQLHAPRLQPHASQVRYSSLLPSARTVIDSYLGHHWRVRTAAPAAAPAVAGRLAIGEAVRPGRLLLDLYPHVIPVHSCGCEPFARDPTHYSPPTEAASFGLNASTPC